MISVIIPLYNKEKQIAHTLRSVLNQTYQDFEVVIVNDGSTDCSVSEVEKVGDSRIRLVHQKNGGVSAARNKGIEEAKYELLAFLDADDEWKPEYLETQYNLFEKYPQCGVYACNYEFRDFDGKISNTIIRKLSFIEIDGVLDNYFEIASCSHPPIWSSAVMIKKKAIKTVGGFPIGPTLGEDLITWGKLACEFQIAYSRISLSIYNFRSQKQLVTPRRAPDKVDVVGDEFYKLYLYCKKAYLNEYIASWHKMRMVTFVRLNMRKEVRLEYDKIRLYIIPNRKVRLWFCLSLLPFCVVRFILFQVAKIRI